MSKHKLKQPIPVGVAVFFIVAGLFFGTLFTFAMQFLNAPLERTDATYVEATLDEITVRRKISGKTKGAIVRFTDHSQLDIATSSLSGELQENLRTLSKGDRLTLLVHPNSDTILEMKSDGRIFMKFEETMKSLRNDNIGFGVIGIFMYSVTALGAGSLIGRYIKARKRKQQN